MKALGMTNREIFINFTIEGGIIGAMGGILGAAGGLGFLFYLNKTGVDVSGASGGSDIPFDYIIHPPYSFKIFYITSIMAIIIPALAAMIPARYANKFTPAEVLRKI